jgi:hypothetical protein
MGQTPRDAELGADWRRQVAVEPAPVSGAYMPMCRSLLAGPLWMPDVLDQLNWLMSWMIRWLLVLRRKADSTSPQMVHRWLPIAPCRIHAAVSDEKRAPVASVGKNARTRIAALFFISTKKSSLLNWSRSVSPPNRRSCLNLLKTRFSASPKRRPRSLAFDRRRRHLSVRGYDNRLPDMLYTIRQQPVDRRLTCFVAEAPHCTSSVSSQRQTAGWPR